MKTKLKSQSNVNEYIVKSVEELKHKYRVKLENLKSEETISLCLSRPVINTILHENHAPSKYEYDAVDKMENEIIEIDINKVKRYEVQAQTQHNRNKDLRVMSFFIGFVVGFIPLLNIYYLYSMVNELGSHVEHKYLPSTFTGVLISTLLYVLLFVTYAVILFI